MFYDGSGNKFKSSLMGFCTVLCCIQFEIAVMSDQYRMYCLIKSMIGKLKTRERIRESHRQQRHKNLCLVVY